LSLLTASFLPLNIYKDDVGSGCNFLLSAALMGALSLVAWKLLVILSR